jgi:hypothetical protein
VQAIMDLACPQLVFNRTILMGDTSFVIRPHTAASTSKGIANAFALAGGTCRKAGIIPIARSLAAVGVETRPATDELWARSRQAARALNNQKKRESDLTAPAFAPRSKLSWTWTEQCRQMSIMADSHQFSIACRDSTAERSNKGLPVAWTALPNCPRQPAHCRDRRKDPTYMCSHRAKCDVCTCVRRQLASTSA